MGRLSGLRDLYSDLKKDVMGIIEERRKRILEEMEAGQGSAEICPKPVPLEPPFTPFSLNTKRRTVFEALFRIRERRQSVSVGSANSSHLRFIKIKPSREDKSTMDTAEQFLLSLPAESPLAFEIIGSKGKINGALLEGRLWVPPISS